MDHSGCAANWMLEATPGQPYEDRVEDLLEVALNPKSQALNPKP